MREEGVGCEPRIPSLTRESRVVGKVNADVLPFVLCRVSLCEGAVFLLGRGTFRHPASFRDKTVEAINLFEFDDKG